MHDILLVFLLNSTCAVVSFFLRTALFLCYPSILFCLYFWQIYILYVPFLLFFPLYNFISIHDVPLYINSVSKLFVLLGTVCSLVYFFIFILEHLLHETILMHAVCFSWQPILISVLFSLYMVHAYRHTYICTFWYNTFASILPLLNSIMQCSNIWESDTVFFLSSFSFSTVHINIFSLTLHFTVRNISGLCSLLHITFCHSFLNYNLISITYHCTFTLHLPLFVPLQIMSCFIPQFPSHCQFWYVYQSLYVQHFILFFARTFVFNKSPDNFP